ncbi:thioester dehydrase [Shewanella intestini]|uniref:3-hydroxyacyl-ACP dehydratase n=1 Tax=Shewanella intestini TaxID=2017544 RepID=A0ABS5I2R6_9GAMM|nr:MULTISPECIES: 3-hydroxyacyl-ACP dehydratase [Shewanella]MBR9728318.1 3-hydroxyacyl-ACP dehydratase [Shewanella intestini]MRG35783.1 3-hydroxyacyl-ACP dehydratase [Shewanella sp. XMDDZSB0408]
MTLQKLPEVVASRLDEQSLQVDLFVSEDIVYFKGHFDSHALLPGVVQLDWVLHFFKLHFCPNFTFLGSDVIKYQQPILPNTHVTLQIEWQPQRSKVVFKYVSLTGTHASGKIKVMVK